MTPLMAVGLYVLRDDRAVQHVEGTESVFAPWRLSSRHRAHASIGNCLLAEVPAARTCCCDTTPESVGSVKDRNDAQSGRVLASARRQSCRERGEHTTWLDLRHRDLFDLRDPRGCDINPALPCVIGTIRPLPSC